MRRTIDSIERGAFFTQFPRFDLIDHLFVIRALILRELRLKHERAGKLGFLTEFLMPTIIITVHYFAFVVLMRYMPAQTPVALFLLGGFSVWFAFRATAAKILRRTDQWSGGIAIPGVTSLHLLLAPAVWELAATTSILYAGLTFSDFLLGHVPLPNVALTVVILIIAVLLGTGYRLVTEALGWVWPFVKVIKKPLTWVIFLTGGIYFSVSGSRTDFLAQMALYNPLLNLIEYQRHALWSGYPIAKVDLHYPAGWAFGLIFLGLLLIRVLRRWAHG